MDSEALRSKVSLRVSPAALKAQGKRGLSEKIAAGELFRQAEGRRIQSDAAALFVYTSAKDGTALSESGANSPFRRR